VARSTSASNGEATPARSDGTSPVSGDAQSSQEQPRLGSVDRDLLERAATLTPRERQILELLATGARTDQVASQLRASSDEVRASIQTIVQTLRARSKLEALFLALHAGVIRAPAD